MPMTIEFVVLSSRFLLMDREPASRKIRNRSLRGEDPHAFIYLFHCYFDNVGCIMPSYWRSLTKALGAGHLFIDDGGTIYLKGRYCMESKTEDW